MFALKKDFDAPGLTFRNDVPVPAIGPRDVLVAVTHAGICGTDRHIFEWDAWSRARVPLGTTTGHEFVGRVVAVGDAVRRANVGDRVSAEGHIGCGRCEFCRTGEGHICDEVSIIGIDRDGCFAQYVAVPEENVWPVHPSIPDRYAAILDPLGNAVHTVFAAGVSGKSVLVTGAGIIGLMAIDVARAAGATRVFAVDVNPRRLDDALSLGADEVFDARDESWPAQVKKLTGGLGPHSLLEMSGAPSAIRQGFAALRNGGTAAMLGIPSTPVAIDWAQDVIFKGITIVGVNGRRMFDTWYKTESLLLSGKLDLTPIVTHQFELSRFEEGFRLMQAGEAVKVVLEVPQDPQLSAAATQALATVRR
jgi:threonine 3-dehydrogenase